MKQFLPFFLIILLSEAGPLFAQQADTTVVQTFTFGDVIKRKGTFSFPPAGSSWRKVLMYYTLKCDAATTEDQYPCGEWDRITHMIVYDSTGVIDSSLQKQPNYSIANTTPATFPFSRKPTSTRYQRIRRFLVTDSVRTETSITVGGTTRQLTEAFAGSSPTGRAQFVWIAQELTQAGLTAGPVTGLDLFVGTAGSMFEHCTIKMKQTPLAAFGQAQFDRDSLTTVFSDSLSLTNGKNRITFLTAFNWDGASNVLIEFSFTNHSTGTNTVLLGETTSAGAGVWTAQNDNCLRFSGDGMLQFDSAGNIFNTVKNEITIAFWSCGDTMNIPVKPTVILCAQDEDNARALNIHLPWNDMSVYWDAGRVINDTWTSFNRVSKGVKQTDVEGRWNHWAFTKNAVSGSMKMYLNGQELAATSKKWAPIERVASFAVGSDVQTNTPLRWYGKLNDFQIWDKELTVADIQNLMYNDVLSDRLVLSLPFSEGIGAKTADQSSKHNDGFLAGAPAWARVAGEELVKNAAITQNRPCIGFVRSGNVTHQDSAIVVDTVANPVTNIVMYRDPSQPVTPTDTLHVWKAGYQYVYDLNERAIDSVFFAPDSILTAEFRDYYRKDKRVETYEIGRYITPYGKNLDLGQDGFTWVYDVTDYASLLHDNVTLSAGNQEEMQDVKFIFFKGTPPMDVLAISKITDTRSFSYGSLSNNTALPADTLQTLAAAKHFRILTRISGHGQQGTYDANLNLMHCCEWDYKHHYLTVNNQTPVSWDPALNLDCALNPAYPQGGNWAPTRGGGWCPGMPVGVNDLDITALVTPGGPAVIDYSIDTVPANNPGQASGNYVMSLHLLQYGAPHFTNDAELVEVLSPSTMDLYRRINPICSMPVVRIKNNGIAPLTSVIIAYGMSGGTLKKFQWNGSLPFRQTTEVSLPMDPADWATSSPAKQFQASVESPNGVADEYAANNTGSGTVVAPDSYPNRIVLKVKNNAIPNDVSYTVRDAAGTLLLQRNSLAVNKNTLDTLSLEDGCYTLEILTQNGLGLATPMFAEVGSGYCQIMKFNPNGALAIVKMFGSDFGRSIRYDFMAGIPLNVVKEIVPAPRQLDIYPNPGRTNFTLEYSGEASSHIAILMYNDVGKVVMKHRLAYAHGLLMKSFDVSHLARGVYIVKTIDEQQRVTTAGFVKE
jgi:hypothetical protein